MDKFLDKKRTYKEPDIFTGKLSASTTWRIVWYEMVSPGTWKRARPTGNLNRIKDVSERLIAAKLLCKMISEALAKGWRYYQKKELHQYESLNLIECLTVNVESKAAALSTKKSGLSYKSRVKQFCDFLGGKKLAHLQAAELTPLHVQLFIDHSLEKKKSNRTINNDITVLRTIFNRIKKLYKLPGNPFAEVELLKKTESTRFEHFTDEELERIGNHLKKESPELRLFFLHIYFGFLRPASIVQLRARDYDFTANTININPEAHKNRKGNTKQMLWPLREALITAGVDRMEKDTIIFSAGLKPGNSLRSTSAAGKAWKRLVIDGLGINKKLYAAKHTGATNFLIDNSGKENLHWFQNQMGHSNLAESKAYIDKNKKVSLNETDLKYRNF